MSLADRPVSLFDELTVSLGPAHPGRIAEAVLIAAGEPGTVTVDGLGGHRLVNARPVEEGLADLLAGEYARDVLGRRGLLPTDQVPRHLLAIADYIWEERGSGTWLHTRSAWAAAALKMLIRARPSLYPALIQSRTDPAGLTEVARIVNDIRSGLYQQLRAHTDSGSAFQNGYEDVCRAVMGSVPQLR